MTDAEFDRRWNAASRNVAGVIAAHSRGATAEDRADLLQDARLKAWKARGRYLPEHSFANWACTIARNLCRDRDRGRRKAAARPAQLLDEDYRKPIADPAASPLDLATVNDLSERLPVALLSLTPKLRRAIVLFADGHSQEEIAAITDAPLGTVRSRLFRARQALREILAS